MGSLGETCPVSRSLSSEPGGDIIGSR